MLRVMYRNSALDDGEITKEAWEYAVEIAAENNWPIHFTFDTKQGFPPSDVEKLFENPSFLNSLPRSGQTVSYEGVDLNYIEPKNLAIKGKGLIFAPLLSFDRLKIFDNFSSAQCIVYLPYCDVHGDMWERVWESKVQVMNAPTLPEKVLPPAVEHELIILDKTINRHGLHPSDRKQIDQSITDLYNQGEILDYQLVEAWVIRHNWDTSVREHILKRISA